MSGLIAAVATLALIGVEWLRRRQVGTLNRSNEYLRKKNREASREMYALRRELYDKDTP